MVGPPLPNLTAAIVREHCASKDSELTFEAGNYGITTTSSIEYHFVLRPSEDKVLHKLGISSWPCERRPAEEEPRDHGTESPDRACDPVGNCRQPLPVESFDGVRHQLGTESLIYSCTY